MSAEPQNKILLPISWLIGTWQCTQASGSYPGIKEFTYSDIIQFETCKQQPVLKYTASSAHPETFNPMHLETGFLRAREGNELSLMVAHNFGKLYIYLSNS